MAEDVFDNLKKFGLTTYEIKVYKALLLNGPLTSMEAVSIAGIPQPRIYDVFRKLMDNGFVEISPGKKKVYRAKEIQTTLGKKIEELNNDVQNISKEIERSAEFNQQREPYLWLIQSENKIRNEIKDLINSSEDELIVSLKMDTLRAVKKYVIEAISRGVTVAMVVYSDFDNRLLQDFDGAFVKKRRSYDSEVVISDKKAAIIRIDYENYDQDYGILVDVDDIIHMVSYYFYHIMWVPADLIVHKDNGRKRRFRTAWLACDVMAMSMSEGYSLKCRLYGKRKGKEVKMVGEVVNVEVEPGYRQTFYLNSRGKVHSIGGKSARIEEVAMDMAEITPHKNTTGSV